MDEIHRLGSLFHKISALLVRHGSDYWITAFWHEGTRTMHPHGQHHAKCILGDSNGMSPKNDPGLIKSYPLPLGR